MKSVAVCVDVCGCVCPSAIAALIRAIRVPEWQVALSGRVWHPPPSTAAHSSLSLSLTHSLTDSLTHSSIAMASLAKPAPSLLAAPLSLWTRLTHKRTSRLLLGIMLVLFVLVPAVAYINVVASIEKRETSVFPDGLAIVAEASTKASAATGGGGGGGGNAAAAQAVSVAGIGVRDVSGSPVNGVLLLCNVTSIDPSTLSYKTHFEVVPIGSMATGTGLFRRFATPLEIIVNGITFNIAANQPGQPKDFSFNFIAGDPNNYPFDKYEHRLVVSVTAANSTRPVPVAMSVSGSIQAWTVNFDDSGSDVGLLAVQITAKRSFTTMFFSMFVFIMMWILSITVFSLAMSVWIRDRKVEPPTIGVTSSLLFALPALRNSQPGAPVIGCTADVAGFFWCVAIVATSAFLLMINYVAKYKEEHKPGESDQLLPSSQKISPHMSHATLPKDSTTVGFDASIHRFGASPSLSRETLYARPDAGRSDAAGYDSDSSAFLAAHPSPSRPQ
ncbi:hypothetical protein BC831DRAFT_456557 [Entophlyctis helioformis]|nr:hypothetical protein BC831DRAFT_456557 [Entophlyctis helioformis]